jgi:triphosphoribosyl-dephospho-CoA synthase
MNDTLVIADPHVRAAPHLHPDTLADLAVWALREEALLTPKPGLVDRRGAGAHRDMDLSLLLRSAEALRPAFARIARCAATTPFGVALRARLAAIGRDGEAAMLAATGGVNTHRGAIWALGLLIAARARPDCASADARGICLQAGRIARLPIAASMQSSHGAAMLLRHGARGARGEARDGFPHVYKVGLPALRSARAHLGDEGPARLHALLSLIARVDDTCLLYRGGREALAFAQRGAQRVLAFGIVTAQGRNALRELDRGLLRRNASPGGSADLLAATLFVDRIAYPAETNHGNA